MTDGDVPARYQPRRFEPRALLLVLLIQSAFLAAILTYRYPVIRNAVQKPLVVHTIELAPPPPPAEEVKQLPEPQRANPQITAPAPLVPLPRPAPPIVAATPDQPAPSPEAITSTQTTSFAPLPASRPTAAGDLSTSMIHAPPPRYPHEARRKREEGIVVLELLLARDGTVADIRVARSSGYSRLDAAALNAVRRWRWSATIREGVAVQVAGQVKIPFILTR